MTRNSPDPHHTRISPICKYVYTLVLPIIDRLQIFHLGLHSMFSCSLYPGVERGMNHKAVRIEIVRLTVQCFPGPEKFSQFQPDILPKISSRSPAASPHTIGGLQLGGEGQPR